MNLPKEFIQRLEKQFGEDSSGLIESFNKVSPTSIRIHPNKLKEYSGEKIPWTKFGFYLEERPLFTIDPLLHSGCYYVQEASSMFLEQAFTQLFSKEEKISVLDLCAAPGSKSIQALDRLNRNTSSDAIFFGSGCLVANEKQPTKARQILPARMKKYHALHALVTCCDATKVPWLVRPVASATNNRVWREDNDGSA